MMSDLRTQLHDYFVATTPPVEMEEIAAEPAGPGPVRPIRPREPKRPLPRWAIGLAASVVVLLLIGGIAWLDPFFGGESVPVRCFTDWREWG